MKKYPRFTLRVEKELLDKIGYTASMNSRTKNKEIEYILKRYVAEYERLRGKIQLEENSTLKHKVN